ncbi:hypothetical protein KM043_013042 [Ampulex compressa]|nr:hypothetical protein KM043_013042 [Ampulex compressa]
MIMTIVDAPSIAQACTVADDSEKALNAFEICNGTALEGGYQRPAWDKITGIRYTRNLKRLFDLAEKQTAGAQIFGSQALDFGVTFGRCY